MYNMFDNATWFLVMLYNAEPEIYVNDICGDVEDSF